MTARDPRDIADVFAREPAAAPGLRPGDRVCEIRCKPRDEGKSWVVSGLATGAMGEEIAVCYLLHPLRGRRRSIPTENLVHFPWQ